MAEFGERLRQSRLAKGMSQEELAGAVGMTQASISQFEKGQRMPTPKNVVKFSHALGIKVEYLAGQERGQFEKVLLMRNIKNLSPESLNKINDYIDLIKQAERSKK